MCLLSKIWVKVHILVKLFKSLGDLVIFSTTENRDVSSTNDFGLDAKSSDKSFVYNTKIKSPIIELCGTPALTMAHNLLSFLRRLSQCRTNYLIYHFLQVHKGDFIKGDLHVRLY